MSKRMEVFIETERLIIRPLMAGDDEGMFRMDSDMEVHRYLGWRPVKTIEESRETIRFVQQQYADHGIGRWAMINKATSEFVGWTGFKHMTATVNKHTGFIDFGYRLARDSWGQGYATEGAIAALAYGLNTLQYKDVYAMTDVHNGASRHILEKIGFGLVEIFPYDDNTYNWREMGLPTTWYKYDYKQGSDTAPGQQNI